jgi:TonB family protein
MKKYVIGAALVAASAIIVIRAQEPQAPAPTDVLGLMKAGDAAMSKRNVPLANQYYAQAVALGDRVEVAPALYHLGVQAYRQANYLAAEGFFQRLLAIDPAGPNAGRALTWLGNIKARDPQTFTEAEGLYQRALTVEKPESLDTVDTLRNYAALLKHMGRTDQGAAMAAHAEEVRQTVGRNMSKPQVANGVYRMSDGNISAPTLLYKVEPKYTEEARAGKIQGTTLLYAEIGVDGAAHNIKVQRSLEPGLDQQAIDALSQWQFKPGQKEGQDVSVAATIEINFRLQ